MRCFIDHKMSFEIGPRERVERDSPAQKRNSRGRIRGKMERYRKTTGWVRVGALSTVYIYTIYIDTYIQGY